MKRESYISYDKCDDEKSYIISGIYVCPAQRRQGIVRKMLEQAIEEMRAEKAYDTIQIAVDSEALDPEDTIDNADLVEFYESVGFELDYAGDVIAMSMSI